MSKIHRRYSPASLFPLAVLWLSCFAPVSPAAAQLGSLFGGPAVETITTESLHAKIVAFEKQTAAAAAAGEPAPTPDFVLVDVRSKTESDVSMIPGAITKEAYEKDRDSQAGKLVIAYCTVGGRSGRYAAALQKAGVQVLNYKPSILGWARAELPFVTPDGQATTRVHTYSAGNEIPAKYTAVTTPIQP